MERDGLLEGAWTDAHGLAVLGRDESRDLLAGVRIGRLGFWRNGRVMILPVNHVVDSWDIAFRSTYGTKLQEAAADHRATFEADSFDPETGRGWSVLTWGPLGIVRDPDAIRRLDSMELDTPVLGAQQGRWVRLRIEDISGRGLRPADG